MAQRRTRVVIESPFGSPDDKVVTEDVEYLYECCRDSLSRGEAPFASHGFYTQFLDDRNPDHRRQGMDSGFAWGSQAELCAVYVDRGVSSGMIEGILAAQRAGIQVVFRRLGPGEG